ncbi:hypothetical protein KP153_004670, partial [Salmonella enterica]|nr:hypothetical protein [Salmonella enterica]
MESLNALLQGMGLMHLGAGQAIMLLVSLLLPDAAPLLGMFCFGNLMR